MAGDWPQFFKNAAKCSKTVSQLERRQISQNGGEIWMKMIAMFICSLKVIWIGKKQLVEGEVTRLEGLNERANMRI